MFQLHSSYKPTGDQPDAIKKLVEGIEDGLGTQVLLGVTGSGKTFTMANVIEKVQRPSLVIAHNKTLAAQLCNEFREFFPKNRVEYFVSYYDYYQPESYIPSTDTYIEKDLNINDEIDKLRHSATSSLAEGEDVIVVASVSCIYGLGAPEEYYRLSVSLREGETLSRDNLIKRLVEIQYKRSDIDFVRSTFRVRGDSIDIYPSNASSAYFKVEFFGDEIESIFQCEGVTGNKMSKLKHLAIFPATHYAVGYEKMDNALKEIGADLKIRCDELNAKGKIIEEYRINQRVNYDMEMMREMGYCTGIENYSRYFDGRAPGVPPFTLIDYFPKNFLTFVDESHMTLPQIRAMYNGDRSRKENLVEYGFRLPSAYDNRPLKFHEFDEKIGQLICISATPQQYEMDRADQVAEQIIRPTGLCDPQIEVKKIDGQVEDLIAQIKEVTARGERTLVTTLTKKFSETLTSFLSDRGIKVRYMHSEIDTLERIDILTDLRKGEFDVLVGINLLREGLDLPEVSLVAILDADKEGFLRSESALIQTIGRAARNHQGRVIMYADRITGSMERAIFETDRRRKIQTEYNVKHGITPQTIKKAITNTIEISSKVKNYPKVKDIPMEIEKLKGLMEVASASLDFEKAIELREGIRELKALLFKERMKRTDTKSKTKKDKKEPKE